MILIMWPSLRRWTIIIDNAQVLSWEGEADAAAAG